MAFSFSSQAFRSLASRRAATDVLVYIHYVSPPILLAFFLATFTAHSIVTASKDGVVRASSEQTGPGGKPLPKSTSPSARARREKQILDFSPARKSLFSWLSVGALLTFVGNSVVVILHAVLDRKDHWWCGESVAVWHHQPCRPFPPPPEEHDQANEEILDLCSVFILRVHALPYLPP